MAIIGAVNKILRQSFVDGLGNRVVIFLQGCNFRCLNCHNPYTQTYCSHCGICVSSCSYGAISIQDKHVVWDDALCQECDSCIRACPQNSSPHVRELTAEKNPEAVLNIAKGAMKQGVRILSIGSFNSEFVRVTGYLIRRADLENARKEEKNRHSSAALGAGFFETKPNNLHRRERKV